MTEEQIRRMFTTHTILSVVFRKRDGTIRKMICTQDLVLVPLENHPNPDNPPRKRPEGLLTVWELNVGWKSFYANSVISAHPHYSRGHVVARVWWWLRDRLTLRA